MWVTGSSVFGLREEMKSERIDKFTQMTEMTKAVDDAPLKP